MTTFVIDKPAMQDVYRLYKSPSFDRFRGLRYAERLSEPDRYQCLEKVLQYVESQDTRQSRVQSIIALRKVSVSPLANFFRYVIIYRTSSNAALNPNCLVDQF
jgi:hypothetical protein